MLHLIEIGFLLLALLAVSLHASYLIELIRDRRALRQADRDGSLAGMGRSPADIRALHATADQFVSAESFRMLINLIVLAVGIGSALSRFYVLWLLVIVPVASMGSSWVNLRRRWFPRRALIKRAKDRS